MYPVIRSFGYLFSLILILDLLISAASGEDFRAYIYIYIYISLLYIIIILENGLSASHWLLAWLKKVHMMPLDVYFDLTGKGLDRIKESQT